MHMVKRKMFFQAICNIVFLGGSLISSHGGQNPLGSCET